MGATAVCGSARPQGPEIEIILQRFRLTPAISLFGWRLAVSRAGQSRLAANTTTRRQEVDESWTDFNLHLIISLQGWLTGKVAAASAWPVVAFSERIGHPVRVKKRVKQQESASNRKYGAKTLKFTPRREIGRA